MDLFKAIRELHEEKKRLDDVIASLEAMLAEQEEKPTAKRRGRKTMSPDERIQVSRRMREYWETKRNPKSGPPAK